MNTADSGFEWRSNQAHHAAQAQMAMLTPYYRWVLDLFGDRLASPVADAGAGMGHLASLLRDDVGQLVLLEGGEENLAALRQRFAQAGNVDVVDCDLTRCRDAIASRGVRTIVTLDVLEHLPDDVAVLRQFHAALPPGGTLLVKVPALPWLYGPVDAASGHYRRYTRRMLRTAVETAGFTVERCHYMNIAAVPSYFLKSRILKRNTNYSHTFSAKQIDRIRRVMPWLRKLDRVTGPLLGLSVILVARKP